MPITRRERRELDRSLSRLRSGKCLRPQQAIPPSMCGSGGRRKQRGSVVFANPDLINEEAALEEPQRGDDGQGSNDILATSSASARIRTQPLAIGVDNGGESLAQREDPVYLQNHSHLQEFLPVVEDGTAAEIDAAKHEIQPTRTSSETASETANEGASCVQHTEDVGIPINKKWGVVAAHERRFCFDHGKSEWLLEYNDRWMSPGDFNFSGAEVTLKKMLQDYQSNTFTSKSHKRASPAECKCRLWSEVDTPMQHDDIEDKYLIRWKWRWTPESDIDDLNWVNASYKAQNAMIKRRCSARVEKTEKARVANRKSMMVVVELEKWLVE